MQSVLKSMHFNDRSMPVQTPGHRHTRGMRHRHGDRSQIFGFQVMNIRFAGAARHHRRLCGEGLQQVITALGALGGAQIGVENRFAAGDIGAQRNRGRGAQDDGLGAQRQYFCAIGPGAQTAEVNQVDVFLAILRA